MLTLLALAAAAAAPAGPTLGPIRVQLYYKTSGTLSPNLAPPPARSFWNTGAGEGDVKESAEDMLVSVPIRMPPGREMGENNEIPLTISVTNRTGKVIATRTMPYISIPYRDPVFSVLWVNNIQCAGPLTIAATWGKQRQTTKLSFDCGE